MIMKYLRVMEMDCVDDDNLDSKNNNKEKDSFSFQSSIKNNLFKINLKS